MKEQVSIWRCDNEACGKEMTLPLSEAPKPCECGGRVWRKIGEKEKPQ